MSQPPKKLSKLFEREPDRWELRGDPHLWREMKDTIDNYEYPGTEEQLRTLIGQVYQQLTGVSLADREPIFLKKYSHGGMSSGYVSPKFWAEQAIPLLVS